MSDIEHRGIISKKNGKTPEIKLKKSDGCEKCPISSCCSTKSTDKVVVEENDEVFSVGDKVVVCVSDKAEKLGVLLSYILPSVILFVSLLAGFASNMTEDYCAYGAIAALSVYYLLLFIFRKKLDNVAKITIKHETED